MAERPKALSQKVHGAGPSAERNAGVIGGQVQVDPVAFDVAAAVLGLRHAVDVASVLRNDEHPGAVGDEAGINGNGPHMNGGAGVGYQW